MSGSDIGKQPEVTLLKSEIEAAAARVAERAMNTTFDGLASVVGDVFGGLVGDRIKQWRIRNLVDTLVETRDHLERKGISIEKAKALPMGELLQIFEGASRTEDADLRSLWAGLLANSMDPEVRNFTDPSFLRLLGDLSGLDAQILHYIKTYENMAAEYRKMADALWGGLNPFKDGENPKVVEAKEKNQELLDAFRSTADEMLGKISGAYSEQNISYSITNLLRLGLLKVPEKIGPSAQLLTFRTDRDHNVRVDTTVLEGTLRDMRARLTLGFEMEGKLPKISDRTMRQIAAPSYGLTGYAHRFLATCN